MEKDYYLMNDELNHASLYGRLTRYKSFDLDFSTNFLPKILLENIRMYTLRRSVLSYLPKTEIMVVLSEQYCPLLKKCIASEYNVLGNIFESTFNSEEETKKALHIYSQKDGFSGWLANLELNAKPSQSIAKIYEYVPEPTTNENTPYTISESDVEIRRRRFFEVLAFFAVIDKGFEFNNIIPKSMYQNVKDFLRLMVSTVAEGYATDIPEELLKSVRYKDAKQPNSEIEAFKTDSIDGIRILYNQVTLNGFEFRTPNDSKFLEEITDPDNKFILAALNFQDCNFNSNTNEFSSIYRIIRVHNCCFDKKISIRNIYEGELIFEGCNFAGEFEMEHTYAYGLFPHIVLNRCSFKRGVAFKIYKVMAKNTNLFTLKINDTQFNGEFILDNISGFLVLDLNNVTFAQPLLLKDITIRKGSRFDNLFFSPIPSSQMDKSRRVLYENMKNAGLEQQAKDLGILPSEKETINVKFDYDAYQIAYNSGFLKPEYAAYFLGKSKVYLQKKRTQDKQKITRDSLPFKIDGRDVQYPVEALLAFKAKDWDTLKNLRKKYPIPTD